jgi:dolichol-phosphate mannosyltransferase
MKKVSIVIPAFNEQDCVEELTERLIEIFNAEKKYEWEAIVIENGSTDGTWQKLRRIAEKDSRFKIIKLSRNFRMDGGLTAGLNFIEGDAAVLMSADLQDPPEMIPYFLRKWEEGFENIYGVISKRTGTKILRKINSILFYKIAGSLTNKMIPENASDFRLVDKKVYEAVRGMNERNRFVRGLFAWVGFKSIGIPMERPKRFAGKSNADTFKVLELAVKGL